MRRFFPLLLVVIVCFTGCEKKKKVAEPTGPLVPTPQERKILRAFRLDEESEKGQRKLRELRYNEKKIAEARAAAEEWAELSRQKREREAEEEAEESDAANTPW